MKARKILIFSSFFLSFLCALLFRRLPRAKSRGDLGGSFLILGELLEYHDPKDHCPGFLFCVIISLLLMTGGFMFPYFEEQKQKIFSFLSRQLEKEKGPHKNINTRGRKGTLPARISSHN
jgi:hypothetical protein